MSDIDNISVKHLISFQNRVGCSFINKNFQIPEYKVYNSLHEGYEHRIPHVRPMVEPYRPKISEIGPKMTQNRPGGTYQIFIITQ